MRDIEQRRGVLGGSLLLTLTACMPLPNDLGEDESPGTSAATSEGSDTPPTRSNSGTGPETSSGTTMGEPPGTDDSASAADGVDEPVLDVGTPGPSDNPCDEVGPSTVIVHSSQTAIFDDLPVAYAVYGWDNCCVRRPRMLLSVEPPPETAFPFPAQFFTATIQQGMFGVSTYDAGPHDAYFQDPSIEGYFSGPLGTFELLDPIDSLEPAPPDPELRIRAHLTLETSDWDIDVEVEAPYCSAYDLSECPCE